MESAASIYLKFEMRTPTTNCFMWRNVHAAQGSNEVPSLEAGVLRELCCQVVARSLLWLTAPPTNPEWRECVNTLHQLFCNCNNSWLEISSSC
ncbi:hypothetical protein ACHQM5_004957 [Ranunculus cassubicifolius]